MGLLCSTTSPNSPGVMGSRTRRPARTIWFLVRPQALTHTPCLERFDELVILDREAELSTDDVGAPRRLAAGRADRSRRFGLRGRPAPGRKRR